MLRIPARQPVLLLTLTLAWLLSLMALLADTLWPLVVATAGVALLAIGARYGLTMAVGLVSVFAWALLAVTMALTGQTGLPMVGTHVVVLVVAGAASLWSLSDVHVRVPVEAVGFVPVLVLVWAGSLVAKGQGAGSSWAMWNDNRFHLLGAQQLIIDGGYDPSINTSRDPLSTELVALMAAPNRPDPELLSVLGHDLAIQAEVIVAILLWWSLLCGAAVWAAVPARHPVVRTAIVSVATALPWTWFIGGFGVRMGYTNALVTAGVLLAAWLVWTGARRNPPLASAAMMAASVGALAGWAVTAPVSMIWGAWLIVRYRREHLALRGLPLIGWLMVLASSGAYAFAVTARTLTVDNDGSGSGGVGLNNWGQFFTFEPWQAAAVLGLSMAALLAAGKQTGDHHQIFGFALMLVAGLVMTVILMVQQDRGDLSLWSYYVQKCVWILVLVAFVAGVAAVARWMSGAIASRRDAVVVPVVVAVAAVAMMAVLPTNSAGMSPTAAGGLAKVVPLSTLMFSDTGEVKTSLRTLDPAEADLYIAASPGVDRILSRAATKQSESSVNDVLLRLAARDRGLDRSAMPQARDLWEVAGVCAAAKRWTGPLEVVTADGGHAERIMRRCGDDVVLILRDRS